MIPEDAFLVLFFDSLQNYYEAARQVNAISMQRLHKLR
jgi:hypothetical protein